MDDIAPEGIYFRPHEILFNRSFTLHRTRGVNRARTVAQNSPASRSRARRLTSLLLLQDGGLQETPVLHARLLGDVGQEEGRPVERRQLVPQADRVHRAEGHEQRLMIARRLDDRLA